MPNDTQSLYKEDICENVEQVKFVLLKKKNPFGIMIIQYLEALLECIIHLINKGIIFRKFQKFSLYIRRAVSEFLWART